MQAAFHWIDEKLSPGLNRFSQNRFISSILSGFWKIMAFLIIGALFQIVSTLIGMVSVEYQTLLKVMTDLTFGMLGLVLAYAIAHSMADFHGVKPISIGLVSVSAFLILQRPEFTEGLFQLEIGRFGTGGLFVAIISGLFTGELMGQFIKRNWTFGSKGMPDFAKDWFTPILPGFLTIISAWVVAYVLNVDLYLLIVKLVAPVLTASDSYLGFLVISLILVGLFTIGINGGVTFGIMFPLWFAAIGENAALVAQGLDPIHINTIQTLIGWVVIGGTGATLTLNFLMLRSKSTMLKSLGKGALIPSLMNINEPLIFGLPIVFNPILAIPFILNGAIINPTLVWLTMNFGLVTKPFVPLLMPWLPVGVTGFMFNHDWRGVVLVLILMVINIAVWYPFFKVYEKQMVEKEASEV